MLAIGNGESRKRLSLTKHAVGCNALHRDFEVDHLICVDRRCLLEALQSSNTKSTKIYTRKEWIGTVKDTRVQLVPELPYQGNNRADDPWHWGSGPFAVLLAAQLDNTVEIIGFDLYGKNNLVNNIYKDTKNYSQSDKKSVDPSYWIYQISKIFQCYPDKYFTVYNDRDWSLPESWNLANVKFETLDNYRSK
jgi:hypothetical protein